VLSRYRLLILALALIPALILATGEYLSMKESEAMITVTYDRQVDGILYSVNQNAWDVVSNWVTDHENRLRRGDSRPVTDRSASLLAVLDEAQLRNLPDIASGFDAQRDEFQAGYRRFDSMTDSTDGTLLLWFPIDAGAREPAMAGFRLDPRRFVELEIASALELVGSEGLGIGIFRTFDSTAVHRTQDFEFTEARLTRAFWLIPDYALAISTEQDPLQAQLRARTLRSAVLIGLVTFLLIYGLWYVYRTVRRESELARLKSDFVANVSHELKTPLALIRMFAETLELGRIRDEAKKQEYYRIIGQESTRLTHLIQNILTFSSMEAGKKTFSFAPASVNAIVKDVLAMYADILTREGFTVETDLDETLPDARIDRDALTEALLNLLDNAMKYAKDGQWIAVRTRSEPGGFRIEIADHGPGIAPEDRDRVFESFYRSGGSLIHDTKGTGLGLSLVARIVAAHGGRVSVTDEPPRGARFILRFQTSL
jgi:two-component system phosphate regulon sensor histidine kinase PhoR